VALSTFTEVEPNSLDPPRGYYQNLFGDTWAEVAARLQDERDQDIFQLNVIKGAEVRIHITTEPGLSLAYQVNASSFVGRPAWGTMAHGATEFRFGPDGQVTTLPPPDATFIAPYTGTVLLTVQGGSRVTTGGTTYGNLVGSYTARIAGLNPYGDASVTVLGTSRRRIEAEWTNSTPRKLPLEMFYARGTTINTIVGKDLFGKKKLTIPITTKLPGSREFAGGGLYLPRGKKPASVTHVLVVVNRKQLVPEGDFANNVVAVPLANLA
jgi:hypothetical protein